MVNDKSSLNNNDKIILVSEENKTVAATMNDDYLSSIDKIIIENNSINELPTNALVFTLKINNNVYNLENNGKLLGSNKKKSMVWDSYNDWQIDINNGYATIKNNAGMILYNTSNPRFTTYTSANTQLVLPQIYKLA